MSTACFYPYICCLCFICMLLAPFDQLTAQTDSTGNRTNCITLKGYVKDLQIASFADNLLDITNDNLIHNRLNFRIYPCRNTVMAIELRTRLFTGETVEMLPDYGKTMAEDKGFADMSWLIADEPALVLLTQADRAWIGWGNNKWDIQAGRQRINWGTNMFWNSNDLFNAYSLIDFDYEELPGTDALRIQNYLSDMSSLDFAVKPGKNNKDWIAALKYNFNKWQYDFQVLGGWWNEDLALGAGWAGNLGNSGFKGEASWFQPRQNVLDTTGVLSASISADYVFSNQLFLTLGALINTGGIDSSFHSAQNPFLEPITAKNLMPVKYSSIMHVMYPITPLFNFAFLCIYSPVVHMVFAMPSLSYSISANWEAAFFGQTFWMETNSFENIGNGIYLRVKFSF